MNSVPKKDSHTPRVAIIGGGISGLAAALYIRDHAPWAEISILESSDRLGGKLHTVELAGHTVEAGAESLLVRRPEPLAFVKRLGLENLLRYPAVSKVLIWAGNTLKSLPERTVLGIPSDVASVTASGVLSDQVLSELDTEITKPGEPITEDLSVAELLHRRLGTSAATMVLAKLVNPLLGGVYAGQAEHISVAAALPQIFKNLTTQPSLIKAAQASLSPNSTDPVFATIHGGLSTLVDAALKESQAAVAYRHTVREIQQTSTGWQLITGPVPAPQQIEADAVIIATPTRPAARLVSELAPTASMELSAISYASVALVTLILPSVQLPLASGILVPATSGLAIKAATFTNLKWNMDTAGTTVIRASLGRFGEEQVLHYDDNELITRVLAELAIVLKCTLPSPIAAQVHRWGGALPQYTVGHLERINRINSALEPFPTFALAGAPYQGVGIAACLASGYQAGQKVTTALQTQWTVGAQSEYE